MAEKSLVCGIGMVCYPCYIDAMTEVHGELYDALLAANVPEDKARAAARLGLAEIRQAMATKQDLRLLEARLEEHIAQTEARLEERIAQTETRLEERIAQSEARQEERIAQAETRLEERIAHSESRLESRQEARMAQAETRLTWRMVGIAGIATAFLAGIITST